MTSASELVKIWSIFALFWGEPCQLRIPRPKRPKHCQAGTFHPKNTRSSLAKLAFFPPWPLLCFQEVRFFVLRMVTHTHTHAPLVPFVLWFQMDKGKPKFSFGVPDTDRHTHTHTYTHHPYIQSRLRSSSPVVLALATPAPVSMVSARDVPFHTLARGNQTLGGHPPN